MSALASKLHLHVPSPLVLLRAIARVLGAVATSYTTAVILSRMIEADGTLSEEGRRRLGLEE